MNKELRAALLELNNAAHDATRAASKAGKPRQYVLKLARIAAETDELFEELT